MGPLTHIPLVGVQIRRVPTRVLSWGSHMMGKMVGSEIRLLPQILFLASRQTKAGWATALLSLGTGTPCWAPGLGSVFSILSTSSQAVPDPNLISGWLFGQASVTQSRGCLHPAARPALDGLLQITGQVLVSDLLLAQLPGATGGRSLFWRTFTKCLRLSKSWMPFTLQDLTNL